MKATVNLVTVLVASVSGLLGGTQAYAESACEPSHWVRMTK